MDDAKSKIGNTPLQRLAGNGFDQFEAYLKDESANLFGTVKDRRNIFIVQEATRLGVDKLALITAGNNGYSLAKIAGPSLKVAAIIDRSLQATTKQRLSEVAYQVVETNLQHKILRPEEVITFTRERDDEVIWDVTNGYEESYIPIVAELRELDPDYIIVPVGSGGVYVGIVEGIKRFRMKAQVIGIGPQSTMSSFADKLHTPWTPYAKIMAKYHDKGHTIYRLTEAEIKEAWRNYQHCAALEPSSAIVFAALKKQPFEPGAKIVFVNSGRLVLG